MRRGLAAVAALSLILAVLPAVPARAATGTYYFHGHEDDQLQKQQTITGDGTYVLPPGFDQVPPMGSLPVTQLTTNVANEDFVGNPLTIYWHGNPGAGALVGKLQFEWWWTSAAPTTVSVTAFADPVYTADRGQPERIIGRGLVNLSAASVATRNTGFIYVNGTVASDLLIQVAATSLTTGNGLHVFYDATTTPSNFTFVAGTVPTTPSVAFDAVNTLAFAPSTTVSAHFFGAEPQTTIERAVTGSTAGRINSNRIFVDWPLSTRTEIGQLSRSLDGGDSFRLLYDFNCAPRSRPNCHTGGGGDTEDEVNLVNGDLFFADQEGVANEALASSTDHGDSWPALREFAVSNAASGVDRQWLAWADPSLPNSIIPSTQLEAFFSYHVPLAGVYVQGVTTAGTPVPQPLPQLLEVSQSGNLRVDNTNGPGRGWIYVPYRKGGGYFVATAKTSQYQGVGDWVSNQVTSDTPAIFPWLNLDAHGNAYAVWVTGGVVYLSVSPIDNAANAPPAGRPGTFWTPKVRVSLPAVGSAVFPAVTAGDPGRIAIAYMGSEDCTGVSDTCADAAHWNTYVAILTDALALVRPGSTATIVSGKVNHRIDHRGQVCTSGTTCTGDRSLLDMLDVGFDQDGRVGVVFMDNNNGLAAEPRTTKSKAGPFTQFAKLVSGPSLLTPTTSSSGTIAISIPDSARSDPSGDATWPNTAAGTNLASLDLLGASSFANNGDFVARIRLASTSPIQMGADLASYNAATQFGVTPATRLQYVFRFSTAEDVYHMSAEYSSSNGEFRFFGGKLGANDGLSNGTSVLGAGYHTDAGFPVVGSFEGDTLTLHAPLAAFGLAVGSQITGAAAFTMAGPAESMELLITNPMRTIDATPPFDSTLVTQTLTATTVGCSDPNIQRQGGWHDISDVRADGGSYCRDDGTSKTNDFLAFSFTGNTLDLRLVNGPRGGILGVTIDGVKRQVNEFRPPTDPNKVDNTGRKDLTFGVKAHYDLTPGQHAVRITNDSIDSFRNMVYLDSITVGGDVLTPAGPAVFESIGLVLGTALAGIDTVMATVVDPATDLLDFVVEAAAGTTVTVKDASSKTIATATVDDGGVLDVQAFPSGVGTYALVLHASTAGDTAFTVWEVLTEQR